MAKKIAVIDAETDPFLYGRIPEPFAWGYYDGERYVKFWGEGCTRDLVNFLLDLPDGIIVFAHNGGKFDFHFLLYALENPIKVISSRIVSARIGKVELRDSYAALPIPLSAYQKTEIDYSLFESDVREAHKDQIENYLRDDCVFLHGLISRFVERFGFALTIGGAAMKQLKKMHPVKARGESHDAKFRPFYYGGRVQCFKYGVFDAPVKIYDVNSMYPAVMRNAPHPTGARYMTVRNAIMDKAGRISGIARARVYFARIEATVLSGGLPVRTKTGLDFSVTRGEFFTTSHELVPLVQRGLVKVHRVIEAHAPAETISFTEYVDTYSAEKIAAKKSGDKAGEIFAKLLLNSAYGKFAQNPATYKDWHIGHGEVPPEPYRLESDMKSAQLWAKPSETLRYHDVATAASITSAARAVLMLALLDAVDPVYCDTDSIICRDMGPSTPIDPSTLGAWKLEGTGDRVAVAGKKLYAVFNGSECIKSASKGAIFDGHGIVRIAQGETMQWKNDAPTFSLTKAPSFLERAIASRNFTVLE